MTDPAPSSPFATSGVADLSITQNHAHKYKYNIRSAQLPDLARLPAIECSAAQLFTSIPALASLANDDPVSATDHEASLKRWADRGVSIGQGGTFVAIATPDRQEEDGEQSEGEVVGFIMTELLPMLNQPPGPDGEDEGEANTEARGYFIHINELSISNGHQRRGLAGRLLDAVEQFAQRLKGEGEGNEEASTRRNDDLKKLNVLGLSLTTFQDVPFNAPFYENRGFVLVDELDIGELIGSEGVRIWKEDGERLGGLGRRCWMVFEV